MGLEFFGTNSDWTKKGEKVGGARGSGELGGIYTSKITGKSALIKRDPESPNFDIAEYMSSKIFAAVSPGAGATVEMMIPKGEANNIPGNGSNVYVRSEFFDHYSDMFKDMDIKDEIHNLTMKLNGVKPMDSNFECVGCGS